MSISYITKAATSPLSGAVTSVTVSVPAGVRGDLMLTFITGRVAESMAAPSGLTLRTAQNGTSLSWACMYRILDGTEPASYTVTTTSSLHAGVSLLYRGVDPVNPFDVTDPTPGSGTTTQVAMPAISPVTAGAFVLGFRCTTNAAAGPTNPYTFSTATGNLRDSVTATTASNSAGQAIADYLRAATGSFTADLTDTTDTPTQNRAQAFALRPLNARPTVRSANREAMQRASRW